MGLIPFCYSQVKTLLIYLKKKKKEMWLNSQTISLLPTSEAFLYVSGSSLWSQQNSIPKLLYTEAEITFYKSVSWWGKD